MAITRKLPNTDVGRNIALKTAKNKKDHTAPADVAITTATSTRLNATQVLFSQKMDLRANALQAQSDATTLKVAAQAKSQMSISHFIQAFNNGVAREVFPASHRAFYKLDVNSNSVPPLDKETDVVYWGEQLATGDIARVAAGGTAMSNPSIADVNADYTDFMTASTSQSTLKDAYDNSQEAVSNMRPDVDKLVLKIWDEVETFFNEETIESKRRKAREWGVVYVSTQKSTISGKITDAATGLPLMNVNVALLESDNIVQTDISGKYTLSTTYTGTGTLEFTLDTYVTQTIPVEIAEASTLTQNAQLHKV